MVLTPNFSLSQNETSVFIYITIPHAKVSGMELTIVHSQEFTFYCRPYLLSLKLPGLVHDEEDTDDSKKPRASYDPEQSLLSVTLKKVNQKETFPNLEFLTTLTKAAGFRPRIGKGRYSLSQREPILNGYGFLKSKNSVICNFG